MDNITVSEGVFKITGTNADKTIAFAYNYAVDKKIAQINNTLPSGGLYYNWKFVKHDNVNSITSQSNGNIGMTNLAKEIFTNVPNIIGRHRLIITFKDELGNELSGSNGTKEYDVYVTHGNPTETGASTYASNGVNTNWLQESFLAHN